MASTLASTLTLISTQVAIDILARFPAEIIDRILDKLHLSLIYFHFFVKPKSAPVQSFPEECHRVREIYISHNAKHGRTSILTYAVSSNGQETVKQMLKEASINAEASSKKQTVNRQVLRQVDASGSQRSEDGLTRLLLENSASPNISDDDRDTPLHFFAKYSNREAIEMLVIQYHTGVDRLGSAGNTPLIWAIEHDAIDMVNIDLQSPLLSLNMQYFMGQTALHRALSKGKPQIAELLLTWSRYLEEHKDGHGKTPPMLCLAKMTSLKDMTPYVPTFKQL
ncbi:ankyrin repeat protein [Trichoderma afarasin]